jgi:HAMP domain-containing protein
MRAQETADRVHAALDALGLSLLKTTQDYAHWSELHDAAARADEAWLDENVGRYVPEQFGIAAAVILDRQGTTRYAHGAAPELIAALDNLGLEADVASGHERHAFMGTDGKVYLAAAAMILPSLKQDERLEYARASGILIFAQPVDDGLAEKVSELTGGEVTLFSGGIPSATSYDGVGSGPLARETTAARTIVTDGKRSIIDRLPGPGDLALRVDVERRFERITAQAAYVTMALSASVAVTLAAVLAWSFGRRIAEPIRQLTSLMDEYGSAKRVERRRILVRDELGRLEEGFYTMTERLGGVEAKLRERSERLSQANAELTRAMEDAREARTSVERQLKETEAMLKSTLNREKRMIELKEELRHKDMEITRLRRQLG